MYIKYEFVYYKKCFINTYKCFINTYNKITFFFILNNKIISKVLEIIE